MRIFSKPNRSRETLSPILQSHSCSKMATRLPNIVQPSAKMSQDGLQERFGTAQNLHFHDVLRGFCNWSLFCKGRAQDSAKVTKLLPKARQVAHLRTIMAPHGPSWRHLDAILAPSWRHLGSIFASSCPKIIVKYDDFRMCASKNIVFYDKNRPKTISWRESNLLQKFLQKTS